MNTIFDIQRFSDIIKDGDRITVDGTNNNDIISTSGESIIIDAKKGNDRITHSSGKKVTIKGGAGKETIRAYAENAYIDGGEGNDFIDLNIKNYNASSTNNTGGATIIGGKGNDVIALDPGTGGTDAGTTGRVIVYNDGDGNDLIQGMRANDTIIIATEDGVLPVIDKYKSGDDYIVNIGSGKITLKSTADSVVEGLIFEKGTFSINEETEIISVSNTAPATVPTLVSGKSTGDEYTDDKANTVSSVVYDLVGGPDKFGNNGGDYVLVYGGAGNDILTNSTGGEKVTLSGDAGNDSLQANGGSEILLLGGAGNDLFTIGSGATSVTVNGGAGNDFIEATNTAAANYYIYGEGEGKDTIAGYKTGDTISLTSGYVDTSNAAFSGRDFIIPVGSGSITLKDLAKTDITEVTITNADGTKTKITIPQELLGTKSADNLTNKKSGTEAKAFKIDGLAGNDSITNTGDYVSISGGAGNDTISLSAPADAVENYVAHGTIKGGKGNDAVTITGDNHAYLFEYASGDGNDSIYGLGESDTLKITSGSITSAEFDGKDYVLTIGRNTITLKDITGGNTFTTINADGDSGTATVPLTWRGTKNADTHPNSEDGYSLYALGGNDSVTNSGVSVQIYGDAGDDTLSNTGDSVTIDGGAGKDVIDNSGNGVSIIGGVGNDSIKNSGSSLTAGEGEAPVTVKIYGGEGVDTIENTGSGVELYGEDGNDIITNSGSSVKIDGGAGTDNISVSSSATGVAVGGGKGNDTITIETVEAGSAQAHTFTYSIGDGNDNIYGFNANDVFYLYDTDGSTTLNTDNYKTEISDKDLIITVGTGRNAGKITLHDVVGTVTKTTINGAEVSITKILYGDEKDNTLTADSNSYLVEALAGNDTVSIGANVTGTSVEGGTGNDSIIGNDKGNVYIYNDGDGNDTIHNFTASDTITLGADADFDKAKDTLASAHNFILNIGKGSIVLAGVIGSSVSSVKVGNDTIDISELKPVIIGSTKADSESNTEAGVLVSVGAGNDTVENYDSDVTVLAGAGNDFLYNEGASSELYGEAGNDTIENYADNVTINAGAGNDHIFNAGSSSGEDKLSLLGGDGNDTIESFGDSVTADGGAGTDYIYSDGTGNFVGGGAGNDTIEIAGSSNTVIYANGDGADTVYGFTENDTLQINSAQLSSTSADGTDVILKIGSGFVRLMDMAGKKINYVDSNGNSTTTVSGAITGTARADKIENTYVGFTINALAGNDTVTNFGASANIDGGTGADLISNTGSCTSIFGGTGNDVITSSGNSVTIDGGSGHDKITVGSNSSGVTVEGGKGNDTITAVEGASNVLFNYASGDGRDVIVGFGEGDTLKITSGKISTDDITGDTNAVLKIGNGSITFNGVAKDNLEVNNSAVIYKATGGGNGNAAVPWFAEDDTNFIGGATVDEITAQEYSVTNVEKTDSTDELTQLEKFTASYGSDK